MRKIIVAAAFVAAAALMIAGCGKKAAGGPPADELTSEIAGVAGDLNAYLSEHNFANTDAGALAGELNKLAAKYGELEKRAHDMRTQDGGEQYGDVGNLAGEGRAKAEALASTIAAGAPMGDAAKATALNDVVENWADYSDRVGAPPGEAAPAEGDEPGVGEPAAPGEPGGTAEPAEPGTPRYPGKGYHYGWWKNPEWARDPASREGDVAAPGAGEKEREREREREHMQPGSGKGGGMGPGGGKGAGGGDAGKGGGGKGPGGK